MSLTPEQIADLQAKAARVDELEQRLNALDGKKGEVLDEKKKLQSRISEMEAAEAARKQKEMEEQGQLQELLNEARDQIKALHEQLKAKDTQITEITTKSQRDKARADFLAAVGAEAQAPKQLWTLFGEGAQLRDDVLVVKFKGIEVPASELMAKIRQDPEWAYHAKPAGGSGGMGAKSTPGAAAAGSASTGSNPWLTGNITERIRLKVDNPELADKLMAEAEATLSAQGKG
jgi:hypothetical protein